MIFDKIRRYTIYQDQKEFDYSYPEEATILLVENSINGPHLEQKYQQLWKSHYKKSKLKE